MKKIVNFHVLHVLILHRDLNIFLFIWFAKAAFKFIKFWPLLVEKYSELCPPDDQMSMGVSITYAQRNLKKGREREIKPPHLVCSDFFNG